MEDDPNKLLPEETSGSEPEVHPFEAELLTRINADERDADDYLSGYRQHCIDAYEAYNAAQSFKGLRKENKFPSSVLQKLTDLFRSDMQDKLWYAGRPCTLVGVEDTDEGDAHSKQDMLDWQDDQDAMYNKTGKAWVDAALYRIAPAQVDYCEKTERRWVQTPVPLPEIDPMTGQPAVDETGAVIPAIDPMTGQMIMSGETVWELKDVPIYQGATVKRIDPMSLLWTQDKEFIEDEFPIMVRTTQSKNYFRNKPYFFPDAVDRIEGIGSDGGNEDSKLPYNKREMLGDTHDKAKSKRPYSYVEWQGMVDKAKLYEYLGKDEMEMQTVKPNEQVWCMGGVVNRSALVRLQEDPHMLGRPNIVIGVISPDEDDLRGRSLYQMAYSLQHGVQDVLGMLIENFKQSVNAMWILKSSAISGKRPILNKAGTALEVTEDVDKAAKRVEQPGVAKDIYQLLQMFDTESKDVTGVKDIISGGGDPNSETLGEANIAMLRASLRMTDYMRSFEDTYIKPLYKMRNQINANFIDDEFKYGVLGEDGAMQWRKIDPATIRAGVDFMCEASTRESNRNVLIQQMLQFAQVAPLAAQHGQPVRFDKLLGKLAETGFSWKKQEIHEILPLLRLEEQGGIDVDGMLVGNAMMMQAASRMQMLGGGGPQGAGPPSPGRELPQPTTEGEAIESANARQSPQVRSVVG